MPKKKLNKKITLACIPPPPIMFLVLLLLNKFLILANVLLFIALIVFLFKKAFDRKEKIILISFIGLFLYNIVMYNFSHSYYSITESNYGFFYLLLAILFLIFALFYRKFKFKKVGYFFLISVIFFIIGVLAIILPITKKTSPETSIPEDVPIQEDIVVEEGLNYCGKPTIF